MAKLKIILGLIAILFVAGCLGQNQPANENLPGNGYKLQNLPSSGFTLHIDAKKHFQGNPEMIAHHYCKGVKDGLIECQLYDSDDADARLVGVETVIGTDVYNSFSEDEKKFWHHHKTEIPKVEATLPDLSAEEAAKVVKSLEETYGKLYILWDPSKGSKPVGEPSVTVLD